MYKIHIGLILQDGKVYTTHQIDDLQTITIWVTCAHDFFFNLTVPNPPDVVHGPGTWSSVHDISKPLIKEKELSRRQQRKKWLRRKQRKKWLRRKQRKTLLRRKQSRKRREGNKETRPKKAKKTARLTHHLRSHSTASGTAIVYLITEILMIEICDDGNT